MATRLTELEAELDRFLEEDGGSANREPRRSRIVGAAPAVSRSGHLNSSLARAVFDLINRKRGEGGKSHLRWSDELARAAAVHSQNMATYRFLGHRGLDGKTVSGRVFDTGIYDWLSIGENVAYGSGFSDPVGRAVEQWMRSAPHRQNILSSDWTDTAIAVATAPNGGYYFTEVFMRRR